MDNCLTCGMPLGQTGHTCITYQRPRGALFVKCYGCGRDLMADGVQHTCGGEGKTLRDEFAMEAMKAQMTGGYCSVENLAANCYRIADAMMEERGRKRE